MDGRTDNRASHCGQDAGCRLVDTNVSKNVTPTRRSESSRKLGKPLLTSVWVIRVFGVPRGLR
jgi:hypothetical protein